MFYKCGFANHKIALRIDIKQDLLPYIVVMADTCTRKPASRLNRKNTSRMPENRIGEGT
jgi:hypothetical protein